MADLGLKTFNKLYPMMIKKYSDLIVDQNADEKDKINQIIQKLNALGKLSNDVVRDWNTVYQWAMNDGLTTDVSNKIETMKANGELDTLLQSVFISLAGDVTTLHTTAKDTLVNSINEVDDLAKTNQTKMGDLTTLQTVDKDTLVHAINDNVVQLADSANSTLSWINVVQHGVKNDGVTDVTTTLQNLINSSPGGSILYFPIGSYLISAGLTINKEITLLGCSSSTREDAYYQNYSKIILKSGTANVDIIKQTTAYVRITIKNLVLWSTSYTQSLNSNKPISGAPASIYTVSTVNVGVNGVNLQSQGSILENVHVIGCSGTAIILGGFSYARFCYAYNCALGFSLANDNSLVQNRANQCGNALSITGVGNDVTNFRIDGAAAEGILLTNAYRNILTDIQTDQVNYCAVKMTTSNYNHISGDFSRVGQYYGGSEIATITDAEKYKACCIYFSGTNKHNIIDFFSSCEELLDDGLSTSYGPATKIVNNGFLISSDLRVAGDIFNGTTSALLDVTSATGLNRLVFNVSGGSLQNTTLKSKGNIITQAAGANSDYTNINGVRSLNTLAPNFISPYYIGEMLVYNGSLFMGTGTANGNWKLYGTAFPSSANALTNNASIATSGVSFARLNPATAVTGIILSVTSALGGSEITLINESANTITFAASGSNVSGGSSVVLNGGQVSKFVYNSGTSLWYKVS